MSTTPHETRPPNSSPTRVGVILCDLGKLNVTALKYLVVHLNTLQSSIEFELLSPSPHDPSLVSLSEGNLVNRKSCGDGLAEFRDRIIREFEDEQSEYGLEDRSLPENFIVISLARFTDEHYGHKSRHVQVQALGNWEQQMAPPSILEFIVVLLMRQAASFATPSLSEPFHLGTKGCMFDFTSDLSEARYKALQSFICSRCRTRLAESGATQLAEDLKRVLDMNWLGTTSDPHCPAGIVAKLGFNLFLTKGLQPTLWDSVRSILRDEATKQILNIVGAILLAFLLLTLGLKDK